MGISVEQWRACIGVGAPGRTKLSNHAYQTLKFHGSTAFTLIKLLLVVSVLLQCSGDVEMNPGPRAGSKSSDMTNEELWSKIENRFTTLDNRFDSMETRLSDLENKVTELKGEAEQSKKCINKLE
ncbi:unnamed protein product, partial [Owenia fusiformis]